MNSNGKMSLVVLRSWSDGPPKVRAIAPPDDDRAVYVPDHQGRFVTEERKEDPIPRCASSASQYKEVPQKESIHGPMSLMPETSYKKTVDGTVYRKTPLQRCFAIANGNGTNRHSFSGGGASAVGLGGNLGKACSLHLPLDELPSGKERPDSAQSPDNPDGSSLEYTPPASPVNGRYRNLGPELAATIPKRTVRNNWIAEVKSRWNNKSSSSHATTHPSRVSKGGNRKGGGKGTLKSYSSSPSLIFGSKKSKVGSRADADAEEEDGDYYDDDEDENFILRGKNGETPHHHRRSSLQRIHVDEEEVEEEEQQPFFNPLYKFSHSGKNSNTTNNSANADDSRIAARSQDSGNFSLFRSHLKAVEARSASSLLNSRSTSGIALSVDDDSQSDRSRSSLGYPPSNNTSYSPSPPLTSTTPNDNEHIYSSLTDIQHEVQNNGKGRLDPFKLVDPSGNSDVVLVEVIRKQGKPSGSVEKPGAHKSSGFGEKYKLEKFGSVDLIQKIGTTGAPNGKAKRHSIGEPDSSEVEVKCAAAKVESSPGKVARFKESLKRFGRFGRGSSDKIVRTQSDSGFSTDEVHGSDSVFIEHKILFTDNQDNLYENPSEIIVTSLENAEKNLGITVKPAQKKVVVVESVEETENIYELVQCNTLRSYSSTSSSELASPSPIEQSRDQQEEITVTDQKTKITDESNLMKQEQSESKKAKNAKENDAKNDRVSPTVTKIGKAESDDVDYDERHLPHLEFDKGTDASTNEESCSSRAESLTYSSTSHEQDRSMPQQIIQSQNFLQKVDISNRVGGDDTANISIDSGSSSNDTLNCEVTPVIRKRSFDHLNEVSDAPLSLEEITVERVQVVRPISSSSVESPTPTNEIDKLSGNINKGADNQKAEDQPPVTLTEPNNTSDNSDMNSLIHSRNRPSSREIFAQNGINGGAPKSNGCNGHEGPEIIAKAEETTNSEGKYGENGTASVQVPVQAVNRHVVGYGVSSSLSSDNSNNLCDEQHYNGSIASTISKGDSEWNKSTLRASLRGFCADMLKQDKISIPVPDVVEAVINFDEDASSIEQDEERENSIEYISVANVKVNRDKRQQGLDKLHPRDDLPSCVIALDLGSRGSGYAYWIREESEFVRIGNVDGGSSCPASHKAPSWVMFDDLYLDGDEDGESSDSIRPGFGFQALDKYLTDDAHGQISWRWREHFHEGKGYPYTLDSKASDDDLIFMMKSAIRHYGRQAMDQISQRKKGAPPGPTVILIAIPSTFDRRARQLVREAALEAGVLAESDSIALIEDSCATGLFSLHALKSKLNKESNTKVTEMSYLSVDCGAAYLHFSGYQLAEGKLRQLILSRSDPLVDSPESLFEAELSTVFTPTYIFNYQNKYKAGWLKLMTEFEHAKNRYESLSKQNYYVFVPSSFVDHFRRFTSMEVEDALESSDMVWNKTGALGIPYWKMQRFLQPLLDYMNDKIVTSMKKHKFDHLVLTGGRAGAKFYVDAIRTAAKGFGATLYVPKEYNAAVLQGSTISVTNLAPRLVIRSRFSIGVGVMTPFSEEHPEEKRVMRDGKSWCADVWDSLIKADQELELNRVIIKRSYVGAQPGQSLLVLPLFKSPDEPKFVTESSVQKCCELKFTSGQRAWQEVELVLVCRPSELLIKAMDGGVMKSYVVVDFSD